MADVGCPTVADSDIDTLVEMMVGRSWKRVSPPNRAPAARQVVLEVRDIQLANGPHNSFNCTRARFSALPGWSAPVVPSWRWA